MIPPNPTKPFIAIACGGTGGHLFPGLAVAGQLQVRGCDVALLISPKEIDQSAVKSALERRAPARLDAKNSELAEPVLGAPLQVFTLPAVGLQDRNYFSFAKSFFQSWKAARKIFQQRQPDAVLAMGGFTSAPPVLAARKFGAKTFLHESNTIPGKANRFLARFVDEAFIGFPEAAARLRAKKISVTGTPVRPQFSASRLTPHSSRAALGLDPNLPTILVVGGSQGARGLNDLVLAALPLLAPVGVQASACSGSRLKPERQHKLPALQFLHLTGAADFEKVKAAYAALNLQAVVKPFLAEMELALGAATACVSRSGASSLAEMAAMRLPTILVPLPTSADNHQYFNALAFEKSGAAHLFSQKGTAPKQTESLAIQMFSGLISRLVKNTQERAEMQAALAQWHAPNAAAVIAESILKAINRSADSLVRANHLEGTRGQSCPRSV